MKSNSWRRRRKSTAPRFPLEIHEANDCQEGFWTGYNEQELLAYLEFLEGSPVVMVPLNLSSGFRIVPIPAVLVKQFGNEGAYIALGLLDECRREVQDRKNLN
jgi:hypothetical protein